MSSLYERLIDFLSRATQPGQARKIERAAAAAAAAAEQPAKEIPTGRAVSALEFFGRADSWHRCESSWVHSYAYYPTSKTHGLLRVRYKGGASGPDRVVTGAYRVTCEYANVPPQAWAELQAAPSKGGWVHSSGLYGWPYTLVS